MTTALHNIFSPRLHRIHLYIKAFLSPKSLPHVTQQGDINFLTTQFTVI